MAYYNNKTGFDEETGLFNKEIKESFLQDIINEGTTDNLFRGTLKLIAKAEVDFDKDLFEMSEQEIDLALHILRAKTKKSITSRFSAIRRYDQWAYDNGYTNGKLAITSFLSAESLDKYVHKADMFISYEELLETFKPYAEIEDPTEREKSHHPKNYQDLAVMLLLWEGIRGKEMCEITQLRRCDLHEDTLIVDCRDSEGNVVRSVKVQAETMRCALKAMKESQYITNKKYKDKKGEAPSATPRYVPFELPLNQFVFRQPVLNGSERKTNEDEPMRAAGINRRITALTSKIRPHLVNQTIYQSGMMYKLLEIEDKQGVLTTEDYKRIVVEYGIAEESYFAYKQLYLINFNTESIDKIGK